MKIYFKISTLICFLTYHLTSAQQIKSPLEASFDDYQHLKEDSHYHLDWVSLGPMLNSARADVVQLDARHPGTMYVGFGSGGCGRPSIMVSPGTAYSKIRLQWALEIWSLLHLILLLFT